ncbi:MAG TPA: type II secretion system F family protein [Methylomirabilota bacterium]|jgi:type IV pilus assembly protein PilC|nr:type II secretion system F family protein [Methylomirabilota bacterium]
MAVFAYQGRSAAGMQKGEIEAPDRTAAVGELRKRAILVTQIAEKTSGKSPVRIGSKVKDKEMAIFTRQFSTMIDAGLPLIHCLNILAEQSESRNLRGVTSNVARTVEEGSTLAESLRKHPRTFDDLFTNMVEVGETGGILDIVLQRLSVYIEKAAALKRKVKGAMVYPASIIGVAFLVIVFMLTFVIPTFAAMFKDLGAELPLPTQIVIWLSDFVRSYILLILAALVGCVFALRSYYRTENGKSVIDALLLKVPVFGTLIRKVAVARFTRTLGTLVQSGVPILEGLRITASTAGNKVVEKAVLQCRVSVTEGKTLAEPLKISGVFPPMVTQMISVGEQTGALDAMLAKIADFYDDEVNTAVNTLTSLLEPIMIVFLGGVVGGLVVAMYLPIFKLVTLIK